MLPSNRGAKGEMPMVNIAGTKGFVARVSAAVAAILILLGVLVTSSASAHGGRGYPDYFGVDKPSAIQQCFGGKWEVKNVWHKKWDWNWGHNWGWWGKQRVWTASWQQLGFSSFDQCVRFVTTPQPESKDDCKKGKWYTLGFNSQRECIQYVTLNGGGGYDGKSEDS